MGGGPAVTTTMCSVAPLGLKTSGASPDAPRDMIGNLPVVSETPDRLVAGFDDHHLVLRVVVDVTAPGGVRQVTATTLVRRTTGSAGLISRSSCRFIG